MAQITYQQLFAMYREEKSSNALSEIPVDFDDSLKNFMNELKTKSKSDPQALKELENSRKLAIALIQLRRQKIVLRAISAQEAKVMGANEREQQFYEQMRSLCEKQDDWLKTTISPKLPTTQTVQSIKKIKILKDIPAYAGADSKEYGPYSQGDEVSLPQNEAQWMVKGQMAVNLEE